MISLPVTPARRNCALWGRSLSSDTRDPERTGTTSGVAGLVGGDDFQSIPPGAKTPNPRETCDIRGRPERRCTELTSSAGDAKIESQMPGRDVDPGDPCRHLPRAPRSRAERPDIPDSKGRPSVVNHKGPPASTPIAGCVDGRGVDLVSAVAE